MTSNEETESNTEKGDSNRVYAENPQEKEDLTEATSKEQEGEKHLNRARSIALIVFSQFEGNLFSIALKISWNHEGYQQMNLVT